MFFFFFFFSIGKSGKCRCYKMLEGDVKSSEHGIDGQHAKATK